MTLLALAMAMAFTAAAWHSLYSGGTGPRSVVTDDLARTAAVTRVGSRRAGTGMDVHVSAGEGAARDRGVAMGGRTMAGAPPAPAAPPRWGPPPDPNARVAGCRVCRDAAARSRFRLADGLNKTTRLVCQAFWHRRFPGDGPEQMWCVSLHDIPVSPPGIELGLVRCGA